MFVTRKCNYDFTDSNVINGDINVYHQPIKTNNSQAVIIGNYWAGSEDDYALIDAGDNNIALSFGNYTYGLANLGLYKTKCLFDNTNKSQSFGHLRSSSMVVTLSIESCSFPNDDVANLVVGVVRDADSGNPLNILSNINFSS